MLSATKSLIKTNWTPCLAVQSGGQRVAFAIAKSDLLVSGDNPGNIRHGNTLIDDRHEGRKFRYQLANPPYGVTWKREKPETMRTSPGDLHLPRVVTAAVACAYAPQDEADHEGGGRIAVITNGSLFTGDAGAGEHPEDDRERPARGSSSPCPSRCSSTRASPPTSGSYQRRGERCRGKVQLIDAREMYVPLKKSLTTSAVRFPI